MKTTTLERLEPLLAVLRSCSVLREVQQAVFHLDGRDFIHFHETPDGSVVADVRLTKGQVRLPAATQAEQAELLERIEATLTRLESHTQGTRSSKRGTKEQDCGERGGASRARSSAIELQRADTPERVALTRDLFREYAAAIGTDLEYQGFAAELASLPGPYTPPDGVLLVARTHVDAAGCVALRRLDAHTGEMKRLYVREAYRSTGVGERLVAEVIRAALAAGYTELRLDTLPSMAAAQALYRRLGFVEIPPYNAVHLPGTRFYALKLRG